MPRPLTAIAALAFAAAAARATTIVPIADAALVDRARLIAQVEIERSSVPELARTVTDWTVSVERVLKGRIGEGRIVVRLPGGRRSDGGERRIFGTPAFAPGRRALLFLSPRKDGTYELADFAQGAFLIAESTRRPLAVRDLSEVRVVAPRGRRRSAEPLRDLRRFSDWIEDRAAGSRRAPDYEARPGRAELDAVTSEFTLLSSNGLNFRWFQFDSGGSVPWRLHVNDVPGLSGGGEKELKAVIAKWTFEQSTPVRLDYAGRTTASGGFVRNDGQNVVMAGDPNGEISGSFDCATGGTLAIGGFDASGTTGQFNGKTYYRISEGEVILQDGIQCKQFQSPDYKELIEEILGHELGHTLGLGHSSELANEPNIDLFWALMYYRVKDNAAGAQIRKDDIAGLQSLYRRSAGVPPPPPQAGCATGAICLVNGRFELTATWQNQFNGTSGTATGVRSTDLAGFFYFTSDPNAYELMVKMADYDGKFLLFFSELTKVDFVLTVRDKIGGRTKTYRNTPGNCGGIDLDFVNGTGIQAGSGATQVRDLGTPRPPRGKCTSSSSTLCLLQNVYSVEVPFWRNQFDGKTGSGTARPLNPLAGGFHFSADPRDLEIVIMLNQYPGKVLAFYGAVNVFEYRVVLTNETSGRALEFYNPPGAYCGGFVDGVP